MADDAKKPPSPAARGFAAVRVLIDRAFARADSSDAKVADLERRLLEVERLAGIR